MPRPSRQAERRKQLDELKSFETVYGARQVQQLEAHLTEIRRRERENAHGNRRLFLSDHFVAQLLAFHQPIVRSLRMLDALSGTPTAQQMLQVERLPRSTQSDFNKVVDANLLQPLLDDLAQHTHSAALPSALASLGKRLVALDGTFLRVVGELLWTLRQKTDNERVVSKPRLDLQLDIANGLPRFAVLSGRERSECNAARLHIEPHTIYIGDKAYFSFQLLRDWLEREADFVVAINSQLKFTPDEENNSTVDVADANILSDRRGHLTGCSKSKPPTQRLREIFIRRDNEEPLRLLTSLIDPKISAETIGEIYRARWKIELFFRWLKSCANFRHVISHSQNGLTVALYVALIGTLLSAQATGRRPSKHLLASLGFVAAGLAELKDIFPALDRFDRERELARERYAKKRAEKRALQCAEKNARQCAEERAPKRDKKKVDKRDGENSARAKNK